MQNHFNTATKGGRCFNNIPQKQISDWNEALVRIFEDLKEKQGWNDCVHISYSIIQDVTQSYLYDIERMVCFHNMVKKGANCYKKAAYFSKWILKLKPVYFHSNNPDDFDDSEYLRLNSVFALYFSFLVINVNFEEISSDKAKIEDILYNFHYRNISEDLLAIFYQSFQE